MGEIIKKEIKKSAKPKELWQVEVQPRLEVSHNTAWTHLFNEFVSQLKSDSVRRYGAVANSEVDLREKSKGSAYFLFPNELYSKDFRERAIEAYQSRRGGADFLGGVWIREVDRPGYKKK